MRPAALADFIAVQRETPALRPARNPDDRSLSYRGHAIMALDMGAFGEVGACRAKVDETWSVMQASPTLPGFDAGAGL